MDTYSVSRIYYPSAGPSSAGSSVCTQNTQANVHTKPYIVWVKKLHQQLREVKKGICA